MIVAQSHKNYISPREKFEKLRQIHAEYAEFLSAQEILTLNFIFMRTYFWGKDREFIKRRHFLKGIPGTISALPIGKTALDDALAGLKKKGLILSEATPKGCYYSIVKEWNVVMLKTPKSEKAGAENGLKMPKKSIPHTGTQAEKHPASRDTYNNEHLSNKTRTFKESESPLSQSGQKEVFDKENNEEDLETKVKKIKEAHSSRLDKKKISAAARESVSDLEFLWKVWMRKHHPEIMVPAWSVKERGQIKNFRNATHAEKNRLWPFLEFSVENWHRIAKLRFGWMKNIEVPEFPRIDFLIGFQKHFQQAYGDQEFHTRAMALSETEREIRKLVKQGYTREQAEGELEAQFKKREVFTKLAKKTSEAERAARHLGKETEEWRKRTRAAEIRAMEAEEKLEKLNRGSNIEKPALKKKKVKRDKDGYAIFES